MPRVINEYIEDSNLLLVGELGSINKYKIYIERKKNMLENTYTLENGIKIPKLGLGTWFIDDSKVAEAVREAVKIGYRMIDTAQAYGNEVICCEV